MKNKYVGWVAYTLFLIVLTEIASRIVLFKICNNDPPKIDCSSCWRIYWVKNQLKKNKFDNKDFGGGMQGYAIHDSVKGWNLKPGIKHYRCLDGALMNTNSKGLRGQVEYPYEKTLGRKRIVIIGDSFAMGATRDDNEIFSYYLAKMLPNVDVLNLGVGAYGHDQILLKLKEEGVKYNPDIVVLFYTIFDNHRNLLVFRDFAKQRYVFKNKKLMLNNVPVDTPDMVIRKEKFHLYFVDILHILVYKIKESLGLVNREEKELTKALIEEMKRACDSINAKFVAVAIKDGINDKFLLENLANEEIIFLFLDVFNAPQDAFSGHWKATGHLSVAQGIFNGLLKHNLVLPE